MNFTDSLASACDGFVSSAPVVDKAVSAGSALLFPLIVGVVVTLLGFLLGGLVTGNLAKKSFWTIFFVSLFGALLGFIVFLILAVR